MASNKIWASTPVALTVTPTTNILCPAYTSVAGAIGWTGTQPYIIVRHIRIVNKTGTAATFSLWKGATGGNVAGTEVVGTALSVAANSAFDWYGMMRFDAADFLVGGAGTGTALTIQMEGEVGLV